MSQLSSLWSMLAGGAPQQAGGGLDAARMGMAGPYTPGMRFAAPAQVATPGQLQGFNRDSGNYAEAAALQAQDEENMRRMQGAGARSPMAPAAPPAAGGILSGAPISALNRALSGQ